jgi:cytoskeletal protein RodZ
MDNLYKLNYLLSLSFIIIGIFLYITSDGHQSFSAQDEEEEETSDINNDEESTSNDIFSDLSRNLPSIDEKALNENGEPLESDEPLFESPDIEALNDNNGIDNSENIVESNEQGIPSQSIEKSLNSGFSDSNKETDIINEEGDGSGGNIETSSSSSSSNEVSNDEEDDNNNNNNIINNSD